MAAQTIDVPKILKSIVAPEFPIQVFNVLDYGATNDGITDSRVAINRAITACSNAQGGIVLVPVGKYYLAGSVVLKSNVNLKVEEGAEIILHTGTVNTDSNMVMVPNIVGNSTQATSALLNALGLKVNFVGNGIAATQSIEGKEVKKGTTITVNLDYTAD